MDSVALSVASDSKGFSEIIKANSTLIETNKKLVEENLKLKETLKSLTSKVDNGNYCWTHGYKLENGIILELVQGRLMDINMKLLEIIPWVDQR